VPPPARAYDAAEAYGAPVATRQRARDLAEGMQADYRRVVLTRNRAAAFQAEIGERERRTRVLRTFSPLLVPGLLQTEAYMRVVFGSGLDEETVADAVRARQRRQELLGDGRHQFVQVMTYGALTWCAGSPEVMAEQLSRVVELSRLPGVRIGVVPPRTPAATFPLHAIDLYDDRAAIFGTVTATAVLTDPADVQLGLAMFEAVEALAVFGDAARQLLRDEARAYTEEALRAGSP
jgi:hypothetical protein